MKPYARLWTLARPYYERGRPMDIDHIEWMMGDATTVSQKENLDGSILLPLVILHDVGYAEVPKDNPFKLDMRKAHMEAGAKIARRVLDQVEYPQDRAQRIVHYVSIHDNWAFGDNDIYTKDPLLGTFNDLDYMWMATPKGFDAVMNILKKNQQEMLRYLEENDKPAMRPFSTATARAFYDQYMADRRSEVLS